MYINPNEVLVKRSDLLAVTDEDGFFLAGGMVAHYNSDPADLQMTALRCLTAAEHIRSLAAKEVAKQAKEWEREHAVPLALTMYNAFHKSSENYKEDVREDDWLTYYEKHDHAMMKWVRTASAVLKAQETDA